MILMDPLAVAVMPTLVAAAPADALAGPATSLAESAPQAVPQLTQAVARPLHRPGVGGAAASPMIGGSVMMVDDEPILIELVGAFLEEAGYRDFHGETDPRRALPRMRAELPDVLLLDLMMPGLSGFEVLRQVRADPQLQQVPVIVMTSASDARTKLRVLELGATDFLEKPVDPSELVLRLRNTLAFKAYRDRSAWFDMLTGLPNRRLLSSQVGRALRRRAVDGDCCALLLVEVGRLRQLAETIGQRSADQALVSIASRLQDAVRAGDAVARVGDDRPPGVVARLGSDEFAVLLTGLGSPADAASIARRLRAAAGVPLDVQGRPWMPAVSVGVATAPDDADEIEALLRCARSAASNVRDAGGGVGFYSSKLNADAVARLALESDLRRALERGEGLELHYQPKFDARSGALASCEALVRWRHPERGLIGPGEFVPVAEESGLVDALGAWVLAEACRAARRWLDAGTPCRVAVNIAATHFADGRLLQDLREALDAAAIEPRMLIIELTESMLMGSADGVLRSLAQLRSLGVAISLDDFGTGWSSLAYLKRMPIDELKIDRSFVAGLPDDAGDAAIVRSVITLASSLGLRVVAEGVETQAQADWLAESGCALLQGWLFSKALDEPTFAARLADARRAGRPARPAPGVDAGR
jgi:diguanylate cyclase (GGDEF)-like protein